MENLERKGQRVKNEVTNVYGASVSGDGGGNESQPLRDVFPTWNLSDDLI